MNKFKAIIVASCLITVNAFAQKVPTESFKPVGVANSNSVNLSGPANSTTMPSSLSVPSSNSVLPSNQNQIIRGTGSKVFVPAVPTVPVPTVNVPNNITDIQALSLQSNEEYMKRRNSAFESDLTKCIDEIPKNYRGERSPEAMLKCANVSKVNSTMGSGNNNTLKPSYLTDKPQAVVPNK